MTVQVEVSQCVQVTLNGRIFRCYGDDSTVYLIEALVEELKKKEDGQLASTRPRGARIT